MRPTLHKLHGVGGASLHCHLALVMANHERDGPTLAGALLHLLGGRPLPRLRRWRQLVPRQHWHRRLHRGWLPVRRQEQPRAVLQGALRDAVLLAQEPLRTVLGLCHGVQPACRELWQSLCGGCDHRLLVLGGLVIFGELADSAEAAPHLQPLQGLLLHNRDAVQGSCLHGHLVVSANSRARTPANLNYQCQGQVGPLAAIEGFAIRVPGRHMLRNWPPWLCRVAIVGKRRHCTF
mmetsp:Transcript_21550/g.64741  ORF Transcript_21550/g.64741 Transcript_21550/m.64741 type:complete len:235 (+) Transcript_21550:285-989(+)